jgi:predicted DNA-binding protein
MVHSMVARTKTVGTKVTPEVYEALSRIASDQNKTVADVMRELIDQGVSDERPRQIPDEVLEKIESLEQMVRFHHNALGELLVKAVKASAGALYYSQLNTSFGQDLTSFVSMSRPLDKETKKEQLAQFSIRSKEFEEQILSARLEHN